MTVWDGIRSVAVTAGAAAKLASTKAKLKAEIALVDREIDGRKRKFGAEMYDHCAPLTEQQSFYADEDKLTQTLRPHLIRAQKEIAALDGKKNDFKQVLTDKQTHRAGSFPVPATTFGEQAVNAGKTAAMMGSEAKTKTDVAVKERQILTCKEEFGLELFDVLVGLEDQGWLPPDRNIRAIYDQCRRDMDDIVKKKDQRKEKLSDLGGGGGTGGLSPSSSSSMTKTPAITYREEAKDTRTGNSTVHRNGNAMSMASQYGSTLSKAVSGGNRSMQSKMAASVAVAATKRQVGSMRKSVPAPSAPASGNPAPAAPPAFQASFSSSTAQLPAPSFNSGFSSNTAPIQSPPTPPEFKASFPSVEPPTPPPAFDANFSSTVQDTSRAQNPNQPSGVPAFQNNSDLLSFDFDS